LIFLESTMKYPTFKQGEDIEDFHGTKIPDPFRWLEKPDAEDTKNFVDQENALFEEYKNEMPNRPELLAKLKEVYNYPKYGCPKKHGDYYYYRNVYERSETKKS